MSFPGKIPSSDNLHFEGSIFFLLIVTINLVMKACFRAVAAWFPNPAPAQSISGVIILVLTMYTGYNIPEPSMIGALHWIIYINVCASFHIHQTGRLTTGLPLQPLRYAYEAFMTNEFRTINAECSNLVPQGPGYENITLENQICAVVGALPGESTVNGLRHLGLSFNYELSHMWRVRNLPSAFPAPPVLTTLSRTMVLPSLSVSVSSQHTSSSPNSSPNLPKSEPSSHSSVELYRSPPPFIKLTMSRRAPPPL